MNIYPIRYTPHLNNPRRRQKVVDPRAKSQQGIRQNSAQPRCSTQQSPNRTPSQGDLRQNEVYLESFSMLDLIINWSTCIGTTLCDSIQNYQQLFLSTQIRRSPSFRLKNYHPTDTAMNSQLVSQQKRPNLMINSNKSKDERINRINILDDILQQMEQNPQQQTRQSLSTEMTTVPKTKFEILNTRTLTEYEQNIEELHFYLVESQQKIKQYAYAIEQQKVMN